MVEKNQQISKWNAICAKSKFVNQHRFLRSSGEIADFDRGDLKSEKASVVVLNVGRSARIYKQVSSAIMGIFLKRSFFCL